MIGTLNVIGVGPGDPELLTLKALKVLKNTKVICVPKGREEGSSLALSIVEKVVNLDDKEILEAHFLMRKTKGQNPEHRTLYQKRYRETQNTDKESLDTKWQETIEVLLSKLNKGIDVVFLTIGDPTIYSTFFYIFSRLKKLSPGVKIVIIPGISSINASSAAAKISLSLGDEKIAIIPATYMHDIEDTLRVFDTVVLMKVHRVFDRIKVALVKAGLLDRAIYVSRAGMEDEKIFRDIKDVKQEDLNYFSTVIVKK